MKIQCLDAADFEDLVEGNTYDVISIERGWYRIMDESEEDYMYPPGIFEIVEVLPEPPILTEEEILQGHGDKYQVVRYDDDGDSGYEKDMPIEALFNRKRELAIA